MSRTKFSGTNGQVPFKGATRDIIGETSSTFSKATDVATTTGAAVQKFGEAGAAITDSIAGEKK